MSYRRWILVTLHLGVLFHFSLASVFAQNEPTTADQVIARYVEAIGAERFSSITTFAERGDLYGNLTNFWQGSRSPGQSQNKQIGTYEFYFKAPNLRFSSTLTEKKVVIALHGCDGKVSWYIDAYLKRTDFKPKLGSEYDCEQGLEPMPSRLRQANVKMRLVKKKEVEGRMAWEIKVDGPKSQASEIFYFDAETYLLLRSGMMGSTITYSDYRDVGGMKLPFKVAHEFTNSSRVNVVRELKINAPIDDSRFAAPQPNGGVIAPNPAVSSKQEDAEVSKAAAPNVPVTRAEISNMASPKITATPNEASLTEVNFPNFTSCTITELQQMVPDSTGSSRLAIRKNWPHCSIKLGPRR